MTTVFTLVDAVVLRPLPVAAPDELVWLRDPSFSYPMFEQIRDRGHMLRGVFAWEPRMLHAEWTSEPEPTSMLLVTGAFHDTLGLQPAAGRLLNQADVGNTAAEAQAVAVLSYSAWQRRFAGIRRRSAARFASKGSRSPSSASPRRASSASRSGCRRTSPSR